MQYDAWWNVTQGRYGLQEWRGMVTSLTADDSSTLQKSECLDALLQAWGGSP